MGQMSAEIFTQQLLNFGGVFSGIGWGCFEIAPAPRSSAYMEPLRAMPDRLHHGIPPSANNHRKMIAGEKIKPQPIAVLARSAIRQEKPLGLTGDT